MPKEPEDIDFSTPEGQKEFENLSRSKRQEVINYAKKLADKMTGMIQIGASDDYDEAEKKLEAFDKKIFRPQLIVWSNGDVFFDTGAGPNLLGNVCEGEDGKLTMDQSIIDSNTEKIVNLAHMLITENRIGEVS